MEKWRKGALGVRVSYVAAGEANAACGKLKLREYDYACWRYESVNIMGTLAREAGSSTKDPSSCNLTFEEILRHMGELVPSHGSINWQESRDRCGDLLQRLVVQADQERLVRLFEGAAYKVGGDEHHVIRVSADTERVYKFTHGDNL